MPTLAKLVVSVSGGEVHVLPVPVVLHPLRELSMREVHGVILTPLKHLDHALVLVRIATRHGNVDYVVGLAARLDLSQALLELIDERLNVIAPRLVELILVRLLVRLERIEQ